MGQANQFHLDVPLGWRPLGGDRFVVQRRPLALATITCGPPPSEGPATTVPPPGEHWRVVGEEPLETARGTSLRVLVIEVRVAGVVVERRWLAIFERGGAIALVEVRATGQLNDLDELVEALRSGHIAADESTDPSRRSRHSWITLWCD